MSRRPIGVIDIGSNAIRAMIVEPLPDGTYRILDDERAPIRLAAGMTKQGTLSKASMVRALEALRKIADIFRARGVVRRSVVATSAIRNARNRQDFVDQVRTFSGLRVRVISGQEEARLAFESAARNFNLTAQRCAVVDVGGGSTEVVLSVKNIIKDIHTLPIGSVVFTERFLTTDPVKKEEFRKLSKSIRKELKSSDIDLSVPPEIMIASGGTANALAQLAMARSGMSGRPAQGFEMTQADIRHLLEALLRRTTEERKKMSGLSPERADIIVAGAAILFEFMVFLKVNTLRVNSGGIRRALLQRMIDRMHGKKIPITGRKRIEIVEAFGRAMGYEQPHSEHVRKISLSLFDELADPLDLDPDWRDLLESAAVLHDVGYAVGYRDHHKNSYHLIAHAPLEGFTPRERDLIGQVTRYHRGSLPRKKHASWKALSQEDREIVGKLAAILRIADALDRRHSQGIREVRCRVSDTRVQMALISTRNVDIEREAAIRKSDLFQLLFDRKLRLVSMARNGTTATRQVA